jgi:hypothetical protein
MPADHGDRSAGELFPSDAFGVAEATRPVLADNELAPGLTVELR